MHLGRVFDGTLAALWRWAGTKPEAGWQERGIPGADRMLRHDRSWHPPGWRRLRRRPASCGDLRPLELRHPSRGHGIFHPRPAGRYEQRAELDTAASV